MSGDVSLWPFWEAVKFFPTLLIRGMNSDLVDEATATAMQQTHPMLTRYDVPNVGHAPALMTEIEQRTVIDWLKD